MGAVKKMRTGGDVYFEGHRKDMIDVEKRLTYFVVFKCKRYPRLGEISNDNHVLKRQKIL